MSPGHLCFEYVMSPAYPSIELLLDSGIEKYHQKLPRKEVEQFAYYYF